MSLEGLKKTGGKFKEKKGEREYILSMYTLNGEIAINPKT